MVSNSSAAAPSNHLKEEEFRQAAELAREAVAADPGNEAAAAHLFDAVQRYSSAFPKDRRVLGAVAQPVEAARQLVAEGELEAAEIMLRKHLAVERNDPAAMHSMAEIAAQCDLQEDAERILKRSAEIHAQSANAMTDLGMTLHRIACYKDYPGFVVEAVKALDRALEIDPGCEETLAYKAAMLIQTRGWEQGRLAYEKLIDLNPHIANAWMNYAHVLKTLGDFGAAVAAFRTAAALDPTNGAAWWGIANLKTARFFPSDLALMESVLDGTCELTDASRVEINFALAKALDGAQQYEKAAARLKAGSALRRQTQVDETDIITGDVDFNRRLYTCKFYENREGWGDPRPDPIFILGMPRAGSTLVEQILSSHSQIEGTEELFILHQFAGELANRFPGKSPHDLASTLSNEDFAVLGDRYLKLAGRSRQTDRPMFTDKNPSNWRFVGLIHCMFPNAKIIDVRRNPMDCCFANYAQHYRLGANFSYDLTDLGHHYADYVATMRHFDAVLPSRIHRVIHDDMVADIEGEVRRLLAYVGVPFEEDCLRFYETVRPVHTPSSEQVREPINRKGFGRWRNYEPWLGDLKTALGATLTDWRN